MSKKAALTISSIASSTSSSSISFDGTRESAWLLLSAWLEENRSGLGAKEIIREDMGIDEIDGKEYFKFGILYDPNQPQYNIFMVERGNGELFYYDWYAEEMYPLDEWYQELMGGVSPGGSSTDLPAPPATDNEVSTAFLDLALIGGRWIASTGERMEFFENGTVSTTIPMFSEFFYTAGRVDIEWEARDGLLTFWGTHTEERTYRVSGNGLTMLVGLYEQPFTRDGNGEGLIGRWSNHTLVGDYEFFSDGTGFNYPYEALDGYADPYPFTWYADDKIITTIESQDRTVDYLVQGSTLTIFTSDSTLLFQRVGGN